MPENKNNEDNYGAMLECNLPASINIEEMLVGRLTARQLGFICVGGGLAYNFMFKMSNHIIGWPLGILVILIVYFLGFFKIKKYDRYLYEHWYYYFKYKTEQQIFLNK